MKHRARRRKVLAELKHGTLLRASDLAEATGVSISTIYRDVEALRQQGVPILTHFGRGFSLKRAFVLDPVTLPIDEAALLVVGGQLAATRLGGSAKAAADSAQQRLFKAGQELLQRQVDLVQVSLRLTPRTLPENTGEYTALRAVRYALQAETALEVTLRGSEESYPFYPYTLARLQDQWHMIGYCTRRGAVCTYGMGELAKLAHLEIYVRRPKAYDMDEPETEDAPAPIRVAFDPIGADRVGVVTPEFVTSVQKSGEGIVVTLTNVHEDEAFAWVLGWGAHARVLSPAALQRRVAAEAESVVQQYMDVSNGRKRQRRLF